MVPAAISPVVEVAVRRSERFPSGCCHRSHPQAGGRCGRCCRPDLVDPQERLCQPVYRNEVWQERAKRKPEGMATACGGGREQVCGVQVAGGVCEGGEFVFAEIKEHFLIQHCFY